MVVVEPPPRAPSPEELEALIKEARIRARWRRIRYAALAVAAALVGTVLYLQFGTATTRPSGSARRGQISLNRSPRPGAIVFVASGPSHAIGVDNEDLYAVGSGGGRQRDLTRTSAAEDDPAWTAEGARVVFTREYTTGRANGRVRYHAGVFVMSAGSRARLIRPCGMRCTASDFSWSPDGRQIAFVSAGAVMVMNADGSDVRVVCDEDRCGPGLAGPQWSPDGSRLLFSNQGVILSMGIGIRPSEIWVANLDRPTVRKLTQSSCRRALGPPAGCFFDSAPSWSSDGSMIAFSRLDQHHRTTSLALMRADGSELHSIAPTTASRIGSRARSWRRRGARRTRATLTPLQDFTTSELFGFSDLRTARCGESISQSSTSRTHSPP
jgi:Tol biopolymer transport system component